MSQEQSPATSHAANPLLEFLVCIERLHSGGVFDLTDSPKSYIENVKRLARNTRMAVAITPDAMLQTTRSETPQKPIAWRWRIVSTDEIPWLYATEKPNNLNDELFWDVEPLFAASAHSAIGRTLGWQDCRAQVEAVLCRAMSWPIPRKLSSPAARRRYIVSEVQREVERLKP